MKYLRLLLRAASIWIMRDFAYRSDFFIKLCSTLLADITMPLTTAFIYNATSGIPGWSFDELLLFQGTLIIVFGLVRMFTNNFTWWVLDAVNFGTFDQYLLKPYSAMLYIMALTVDHYGVGEVLAGMLIVGYSMAKLQIAVISLPFFLYVLLIIAGFLVLTSSLIIIASMAFIAVKSEALIYLHNKITDFARYPMNVYGAGVRFVITFLIPIAVSSFFPAEVLLRGFSAKTLAVAFIPAAVFLLCALLLWSVAMKKYTSAGG